MPLAKHDRAFAQDHPLHGFALRAERHADADLARAPRDGIGFHSVNADDREPESDESENAKERRARAHEPELNVAVEMLRESFQRENRQRGIDFAHGATQQIRP